MRSAGVRLGQNVPPQLVHGVFEAVVVAGLRIAAQGSLEGVEVVERAQNKARRRAQSCGGGRRKEDLVLLPGALHEVGRQAECRGVY